MHPHIQCELFFLFIKQLYKFSDYLHFLLLTVVKTENNSIDGSLLFR